MTQHQFYRGYELDLHYAEAPGPDVPLVILHGLSGSHDEFMHLVPSLASSTHVYLLDLRGHGLSAHAQSSDAGSVDARYTLAAYARDVAAFVRQVVGQPVWILGHSLGGLVAGWLAAKQPDWVRGLVLEEPPFYLAQTLKTGIHPLYAYFLEMHTYLTRYRATGGQWADLAEHVGQTPIPGQQTMIELVGAEAVQARAHQLDQLDPAALEPILVGKLYGRENVDDLLAQIRCPVHLLVTDTASGGVVSAQELSRIFAHLDQATHTFFPGAGHDIHLAQPDALLESVQRFLAVAGTGTHSTRAIASATG